jgi:hypothetical protein
MIRIEDNSQETSTMWREYSPAKEPEKSGLTCIRSLLVYLSREKRDSFTLECVLRTFWDYKLAQFCPAYRRSFSKAVYSDQD